MQPSAFWEDGRADLHGAPPRRSADLQSAGLGAPSCTRREGKGVGQVKGKISTERRPGGAPTCSRQETPAWASPQKHDLQYLKWSSLCAQKNKGLWQKFGVAPLAGCRAVVTGSCLDIPKNVKTATPRQPLQAQTDPTIMLRREP